MGGPVKHTGQLIAEHVKTTLEGIDAAGGYNNDLSTGNRVFLFGRSAASITDRPSVVIHYVGEEKTTGRDDPGVTIGTYRCRMRLDLVCTVREGDSSEASAEVWQFLHDVEKVLMVDHTRGGKAIDTEITGVAMQISEDALPDFSFAVTVEIDYMHGAKDPAVTTPT